MKKFSRKLVVVLLDIMVLAATDYIALAVRFDFRHTTIPELYRLTLVEFFPVQIALTLTVFFLMRMYQFVWRAVTTQDVAKMMLAVSAAYFLNLAAELMFFPPFPISVYLSMFMLQMVFFCGMRCVFRFLAMLSDWSQANSTDERVMIVGAGSAGNILAREMFGKDVRLGRPCCFIDDNLDKQGKYLFGVPIVGGREKIADAAEEYRITKIIFAAPSMDRDDRLDILNLCARTGRQVLTMPQIGEMLGAGDASKELHALRIEDLLGRTPIHLETKVISDFLRDKTVLVTGGGGSIGSELCRQIAANKPRTLIILDIYENNAYDIQQELIRTYGDSLDLRVEIASVRDKSKVYQIFEQYVPDIVFHAAAHKHVPLMEHNPEEAVKNNIFGTYHVVRAAERYGTKKFVMISTDKAVNPTNVMGASKRFCEMILQSRRNSLTEFCSVRFGNVLGSNGSVVPLFEKQIAAGGPVTITDKRITRFFMTIPEAVQLVLEAGAMASQNQIYVLDMGKPVTILSLAENMIRLHGLEPYRDIDIVEIGLRPGEKLYEELLMASERHLQKISDKIFVEEQGDIDPDAISAALETLGEAVDGQWTEERLRELLHRVVPTFRDPETVNAQVRPQTQSTQAAE